MPVSTGLLLVFPSLSRPPLEEDRKKEKVTRSYTFRNENVTSTSRKSFSVTRVAGDYYYYYFRGRRALVERKLDLPGLKRGGTGRDLKKRNFVEKMDERERIRGTQEEDSRNNRTLLVID